MSAVSTKIFGSDLALDVKTDFAALYGVGKSVDEINAYILGYCPEDDDEEACIFWSALALIAWEYGVLTEKIKNKAQYIIENHSDAPLFLQKKDETARENELRKLLHLLNTENPNPRKRKKSFVYRTLWKAGDVLALPLHGKYVYLHICAVDRPAGKIKELEEDRVFVQVFDAVTDDLLSVQV
ncbi:MAG: hypothetical protein E7662_10885, partial [Ruminococcaceae bacterium]|nr:hypothetical protein [Oscillospiraceae bacterium]